ncbi:MAG: ABC transporter permease [archaeon]|jgi:nitrate ABC transporter permease subunit
MNKTYLKVLVILCVIGLWQATYFIQGFHNNLIPSPIELTKSFYEVISSGEINEHILASLDRVLVGFFAAAILGIFLGLLFGYNKFMGLIAEPLIEILRPIPPIAWIPIAILLFGLGNNSSYFIVFLGAFFPIFTNTVFGVTQLPKKLKNISRTLELSKFSFFKDVLLKFSIPYIFVGLRIGIGMAWMSVIAAELIGAQSGLGYFIQINRLLLNTDKIVVGMIVIGILGYLLSKLILLFGHLLMPWNGDYDARM